MERRRKALRWMIGLFVGVLLLLTYLSGTIQSLTLPKVAVAKPSMGSLDLSISEDGYLQPAYTAPLLPVGNWKVTEVDAKKGDRVKKGDPLIAFDPAETERTLEDEKTRYEQQQIKLSQLIAMLRPLVREGDDPEQIEKQKQDIESQKLEMTIAERRIVDLEKQIRDGRVLRAPFDGVVTAVYVEAGATVSPGQQVAVVASDASGYQLTVNASGDAASSLQVGRSVKVEIGGQDFRQLDGTISSIGTADEAGSSAGGGNGSDVKTITVDVNGSGLTPGLKATVFIQQESAKPGFKIPVSALQTDDGGTYVYTLAVKEGPLGSTYFAEKTYVDAGEENDDAIVIRSGIRPDERIVTEASEPLSDGDRVRLD